ncbi:MAG: PIN domain-containing protein [Limisphaerales bacterium]
MRLFLDTSVLLAASGSAKGASREIFRLATKNSWTLMATPYVVEEVRRNLSHFPAAASTDWNRLRAELLLMDDVFTVDRPAVFAPAKDRPILFSALAWADTLLTLDRGDFETLLGNEFYGLKICTPGQFLIGERIVQRLKTV